MSRRCRWGRWSRSRRWWRCRPQCRTERRLSLERRESRLHLVTHTSRQAVAWQGQHSSGYQARPPQPAPLGLRLWWGDEGKNKNRFDWPDRTSSPDSGAPVILERKMKTIRHFNMLWQETARYKLNWRSLCRYIGGGLKVANAKSEEFFWCTILSQISWQ